MKKINVIFKRLRFERKDYIASLIKHIGELEWFGIYKRADNSFALYFKDKRVQVSFKFNDLISTLDFTINALKAYGYEFELIEHDKMPREILSNLMEEMQNFNLSPSTNITGFSEFETYKPIRLIDL